MLLSKYYVKSQVLKQQFDKNYFNDESYKD